MLYTPPPCMKEAKRGEARRGVRALRLSSQSKLRGFCFDFFILFPFFGFSLLLSPSFLAAAVTKRDLGNAQSLFSFTS